MEGRDQPGDGEGGVTVRFLGSGDAFGSGGRFQTCILVEGKGLRVLIDCGATSLVAMRRLGVDPATIDAVVLSHLHGDHFGGLPFLLLEARHVSRRRRPLVVAGPPGHQARILRALEILFPGASAGESDFPVVFVALPDGDRTEILPAPGARDGSRDGVLEGPVHGLTPDATGGLTRSSTGGVAGDTGGDRGAVRVAVEAVSVVHPSGAPSYALRLELAGKVIAYSGDTEWTEALLDVARGADLFVCECYGYDRAIPNHLDFETLRRRVDDFECRRLVLTHMSEAMLERAPELEVETAEDGMRIELDGPDRGEP